jgi:hypothetical protein
MKKRNRSEEDDDHDEMRGSFEIKPYPFEMTETRVLKMLREDEGLTQSVERRSVLINVLAYEILTEHGAEGFEESIQALAWIMDEKCRTWLGEPNDKPSLGDDDKS